MKTSELRIGNLAQDQNGNLLKCVGITEAGSDWYVIDRTKFPLEDGWNVHPIPINAEYLKKFGFQVSLGDQVCCTSFYKENIWVEIGHKGGFSIFDETLNFRIDTDECKYVHTFQNLYFYVAGKDLTLND